MKNFILDAIASPSPGQSLSQWVSQSVMFSEIAIASTEPMTSGATKGTFRCFVKKLKNYLLNVSI